MYIPKRYGESRLEQCPFCGKQATVRNKQKIPVCQAHRNSILDDLKCACGSYLETKVGKFGLYFNCPKCGNVNPKRALEMNPAKTKVANAEAEGGAAKSHPETSSAAPKDRQKQKEFAISPDDPDYFG